GYEALALGDHGGVYGAPRFHAAAREVGVRPLVAGDVDVDGIGSLRLLVQDEQGYRNLCRLYTRGHAHREKGRHLLSLRDVAEHASGLVALLGHCHGPREAEAVVRMLGNERAVAEVQRHLDPSVERWN